LPVGEHLGHDPGDAGRARDRLRRAPVVAGEHHHLEPQGPEATHRVARAGLDRVGDGDHPGERAVDGGVHRRLSLAGEALGVGPERRHVDRPLRHERRVADREGHPVDDAGRAPAGVRLERLRPPHGVPPVPGVPDDGVGQRVLARALERRDQRQQVVRSGRARVGAPRGGYHVGDRRTPLGDGARLVEHHRRDVARALQGLAPLDQHAEFGPFPVDTMTAVGTASPMAHGQAMISTATAAANARTSAAPAGVPGGVRGDEPRRERHDGDGQHDRARTPR
jgi:hypothetical protein